MKSVNTKNERIISESRKESGMTFRLVECIYMLLAPRFVANNNRPMTEALAWRCGSIWSLLVDNIMSLRRLGTWRRLWCDPILIYRLTHQRMPKYRNDCTCPEKNTSKFFHFTKDSPFHRVYDLQECKQHKFPAAEKPWYNIRWMTSSGHKLAEIWVCSSGLYSVIMTV